MRLALRLLVAAAFVPAFAVGTAAFSTTQPAGNMPRSFGAVVTGDAASYLALASNPSHPYACMVSESGTTGKLSISFAATSGACAGNGGGSGINAGDGSAPKYARYAFHDLLLATNKGTKSVLLWVNASSTSGQVDVAKAASSGGMTDASYATTSGTSLSLGVGASGYIGVRVNTQTLASGTVNGQMEVVARG